MPPDRLATRRKKTPKTGPAKQINVASHELTREAAVHSGVVSCIKFVRTRG
jgi:hypothetical protein